MTTALSRAIREIGVRETTGRNDGPQIREYLRGEEGLNWCAAFVLWCFHESGSPLPGNYYKNRAVFRLQQELEAGGARIHDRDLEPGDIVVFRRGGRSHVMPNNVLVSGSPGHVGIVRHQVPSTKKLHTIEGNVGNAVTEVEYNWRPRAFLAAYRWPAPVRRLRAA